jgi:hypothetical protein
MLSFRNSTKLVGAAALIVAIAILLHAHDTSDATAGGLKTVARPPSVHVSSPRASTYADEVANINHEGF